jgi:tight adherence protein C
MGETAFLQEPAVLALAALWAGVTLLLGELRPMRRPSLARRLEPYGRSGVGPSTTVGGRGSWRGVVGPICRDAGERVARLFGVSEDAGARLARLHHPLDVTAFRLRQVGWATIGLATGAAATAAVRPSAGVAVLLVLGSPVLAFLIVEQRLAGASAAWQRRVRLELPVITEQLAMLLSAGYSLGAALNRVAARGQGTSAADLRTVCARIRQGLSELAALQEWADRARVPALDRVVAVLALNEEAGDLGRLLSEETRSMRAAVHRELVETMEQRGQQVWIPVTVATLVPGVIFLAVPFLEALRIFSGS